MLNNVSCLVIGLLDQAMLGRLSLTSFATAGIVTGTLYSITGVLGMNSIAFNILGARFSGENNQDGLNCSFYFNILSDLIIGLLFSLLAIVFGHQALHVFYNMHGDTLESAYSYLKILSISVGMNMLLFTFSSYFKIINKTKLSLYGSIISSLSNVLFDYILIFGHFGVPRMGLLGNAIGVILSLMLNVIIYMLMLKRLKLIKKSEAKIHSCTIFSSACETIKISMPLMGQEFLEGTLLVIIVNSILTRTGALNVSIYNLLFSILNICLMPMYAYGQASLTVTGESIGEKSMNMAQKAAKNCVKMALLFYVIAAIIILPLRGQIVPLITNNNELIHGAVKFLPLILIVNVMNMPNTIYKYSLQALGHERWVFFCSLIMSLLNAVLMAVLALKFNMNLYGIYMSIGINYALLSIIFYMKHRKALI